MAKTFDPNRVLPGTIELVRAADGTYTTKVVGLESINSLSLPEISTSAAVTKTDTDTKTATEITGDTVQKQTQMAFKTGDDNQPDTTGDMLQEAKKTSGMLSDTFANTRGLMTSDDAYRGVDNRFDAEKFDETEDKVSIKDPTEKVFGKSTDDVDYVDAIRRGEVGTKFVEKPKIGDDLFKLGPAFDDKGTPFARPKEGTIDQTAANNMTQEGTAFARPDRGTIDQMAADSLGVTADPTQSATRAAKEAGFASGSFPGRTVADADLEADEGTKARADIKPKESALETVSTSLRSAFKNIKTPMMMLVDAVVGPETASQKHDKKYFTDRGDGRIGGNPATDLYAGFNRVSAFGNLSQAGAKRLETRQKTIDRKGYKPGDKFYDDTQKMKKQQEDYQNSRNNDPGINPSKAATVSRTNKDFGQFGRKQQSDAAGGGSSGGGGKIVCTMMNESYGFGSFRNKIWMKFHGDIAPEYQKGYHKLFLPLVNYAKQKGIINKIIKNVLEHIAVHSTIDMRQTLRGKRHTLGRLYRKIILPLCYWAGKK